MTILNGGLRRTASALLCLALAASGASAAELKIENLKNSKDGQAPLSLEELQSARPMPGKEVSPEELREMQQRFRAFNPNMLDLKAGPDREGSLVKGVPEKVDDPSAAAPYWSAGRLTFRDGDGVPSACTAQFVESASVILTAAHCVMDEETGKWFSDFVFQRAYNDGATAQTVGWRCVSLFDAFHDPAPNFAYDYAFILADGKDDEKPLEMAIESPADKALTAIGYPANFGNGRFLYKVDGEWSAVVDGIVTMTGNPMRSGNSGGAWFTDFKVGGGAGENRVISLNSHHLEGNTEDENGPLFTAHTSRLLAHVADAKCLD
ncbi:MAG: trypsin-like peptidase domain-containing protein [Rhizobium sp.]|nr:trypsin-like peptidase domain-containing protein [Rhizobium sp.]